MKNKEAIENIENLIAAHERTKDDVFAFADVTIGKDDVESFKLAIKALEQMPKSPCDLCRYDYIDDCCGECPAMAKGECE